LLVLGETTALILARMVLFKSSVVEILSRRERTTLECTHAAMDFNARARLQRKSSIVYVREMLPNSK